MGGLARGLQRAYLDLGVASAWLTPWCMRRLGIMQYATSFKTLHLILAQMGSVPSDPSARRPWHREPAGAPELISSTLRTMARRVARRTLSWRPAAARASAAPGLRPAHRDPVACPSSLWP